MLPSLVMRFSSGASTLFRQARFTECVDRLRDSTDPEDVLLRAECLLYLCRPSEIVRMDSLGKLADVPKHYTFMAQSFIAAAFFRLGMDEPGRSALNAAYENVGAANTSLAKYWVDYHAAFERWSARDYVAAERLVRPITRLEGVLGSKALALLSWIEAAGERYDKQVSLLRQAWEHLPLEQDTYTGVMILRALAHLSCELYDAGLADFVERACERLAWPPDFEFEHIETLRAIAWNRALAGNLVPAIRNFRKNEHLARTPAGKLLVLTDRARVCYGAGERAHYLALLEDADEIAQRIDWANATAEQRFGLLSLAALLAPVNSEQARAMMHRYQSVTVPLSPAFAWANGDSRRQAAEHFSAGVVLRFTGQRNESINHLREAYSIYKRLKYYWRACLCAHHLSELGYDKGTLESALIWIRDRFPNAWFVPMFHLAQAFEADAIVVSLTRTQREVLRLLLQEKSTRDIARVTERDEKTIRNHISGLLRAFGVKNREQLWKICEDRGLR